MRHVFLGALLVLSTSSFAQAQEKLTLEEALREGLGESPAVLEADAGERLASWQKTRALSGVLPKVSLFATHEFDTKYETLPFVAGPISADVPIAFPKTEYGLDLKWTLFDGLANIHELKAADLRTDASRALAARKRFETRKKIELGYYSVLAAIQLREVAARNLKTVQDSLAIAETRVRNGISTEPDVLRVQVHKTEAEAEVQRTADAIVIERQKLRQIMGASSDERELAGTLPDPDDRERIASLVFEGTKDRDDLRASHLSTEASEQERAAGRGPLFPSISVVGRLENYDNTDFSFSSQDNNYRSAYAVGLTLRWDLLDAATLAQPGIASAKHDITESQYKAAILRAPTDFELWKRRYLYSADLYQARLGDIRRAEESLRIIDLSFRQGRRIINEVLDAEVDLFRARAGAVQSLYEAIEARNQLELAIGRDLK